MRSKYTVLVIVQLWPSPTLTSDSPQPLSPSTALSKVYSNAAQNEDGKFGITCAMIVFGSSSLKLAQHS